MAIHTSPKEWSVPSIHNSYHYRTKPQNHNRITTSNNTATKCKKITTTLCLFLHIPCSNMMTSSNSISCNFHETSSSGYCAPSPILEEEEPISPSTRVSDDGAGFRVSIEFDWRFAQSNGNDLKEYSRFDADQDFNKLLLGLLQDSRTEDLAHGFYRKAQEMSDFRPEESVLRLLMRYLARAKKWNLVLSVFDDFRKYDAVSDKHMCSKLIGGCFRARKFRVVESLLDGLRSHGDVALLAFKAAMRGYNKLHMYGRTVSLYKKMKSAGILLDSTCYCLVMKAYQKEGDVDQVVALFQEFESRKFDSSKLVTTSVYRIVLDALGKSGRAFEALEYFRLMEKKGISEDSQIYSSLICSFAKIREVNIAEEFYKEAREKRMLRDPEVFLKLVLMYVEEGQVEKSLDIVKAIKAAKLKVCDCTFCAIVNGYSKRRGFRAAIRVYEGLVSEGCEPGQVTYASVINAYCRMGFYSKAEGVFREMQEKGFDKCVVAYSSIISMYGRMGRLKDARRLVAKMKAIGCEPNVWIYNSLLDMHGRAKNLREVEKLWKEMKRRKVAPDKITYTSIISAYNRAKEFETCVKFYQEYKTNGGVIDRAMAGIMVGVFSKIGHIDELLKLLQDLKSEGTSLDARLYHSALNALKDAGLQLQAKWLQESFVAT